MSFKIVHKENIKIKKEVKKEIKKEEKEFEFENNKKDEDLLNKLIEEKDTVSPNDLKKDSKASSEFTPYILLIALSFHGLFEGIALGLQQDFKSSLSLALAIVAHKWAEALTLGLSCAKADTEKSRFFIMISIFSLFTPVGVALGMLLSSFPSWVTATFMSLSVGTFIYIGGAEIIVEEFALTRFKWQKYLTFLLGACFILGLTIWEVAGDEHDHDHDHNDKEKNYNNFASKLLSTLTKTNIRK